MLSSASCEPTWPFPLPLLCALLTHCVCLHHAAACTASCTLVDVPNYFGFQMADMGGRVKMLLPPLGKPLTWQIQVGAVVFVEWVTCVVASPRFVLRVSQRACLCVCVAAAVHPQSQSGQ